MATFDGTDEPLFADDLDEYEDDDPPPLPPPVESSRPAPTTSQNSTQPIVRRETTPTQSWFAISSYCNL